MREGWRTRLDRLTQTGQRLNRKIEKAADKYIQWQDRRHARRRQKFLRQGWLYSTLLGLWLVLIVLELLGHQSAAVIHSSAGLGLIFLALKIWHTAMVIRAKKRGEL